MHQDHYDIVIVGASFAGLTLAHHLPVHYRVLVLDKKPALDYYIESTGLVTQATKDLLDSFVNTEPYIPNQITTIGVVAHDYEKMFFSHTKEPWIYSTDTPQLVKAMSENLPSNVELQIGSTFKDFAVINNEVPLEVTYSQKGHEKKVRARFVVGADGSHSQVAKKNRNLSQNTKFLAGLEKVFYGNILLGEHPQNTVYHFWFGEFSLGYGGWLSPTTVEGRPAFRLGLAKLQKDLKDLKKIDEFIEVLKEKKMIEIEAGSEEVLTFGSLIPIGGPLRKVYDRHSLLIGDAAGLCGAFAADGIKGAIVSGKVAAQMIPEHLEGNKKALAQFYPRIQEHRKLMTYYRKQLLYRFIWDRMKSNRSFEAMFDIIARQKESFLNQFCDSKDKNTSLMWVVLKVKNLPLLVKYAFFLFLDVFKRRN
ncbi:MAG: NAD(P)/FAD-dependent oxidoreductase [Candidatus Altimarinota bacterium]